MGITKAFFSFGFQYPQGMAHGVNNPDPKIEKIRERMNFLNNIHQRSGLQGHIFAASMDLFQSESNMEKDVFWEQVQQNFSEQELIDIANAIAPMVKNEMPPLEFPNAIALVDCRFVSTTEWEHIRRYSIGGSEASAVLGLSHFQSPLSLFHEKRSTPLKSADLSRQQILDYGHAVEDYIVESFAHMLGAVRYPEHRMFAHKEYPFLTCNPDGLFLFADGHISLFEAKTAFWKKRADWKDGIPDYYEPQPRHYLEVMNDPRLNDGFIGVCLGGGENDLILQHYNRDREKGQVQTQKLVDYWKNHVEKNVAPSFSGTSQLDMDAFYRYIPQSSVEAGQKIMPDTTLPYFQHYFALQEEKKKIDKEIRVYKGEEEKMLAQIKNLCPDGLTIVQLPNEMPYRIQVRDKTTQFVDMAAVKIASDSDADALLQLAAILKESSCEWAVPKIKKAQP